MSSGSYYATIMLYYIHVALYYVMLYCITSYYDTIRHYLHYIWLCCVRLCYVTSQYLTSQYVIFHHIILCYIIHHTTNIKHIKGEVEGAKTRHKMQGVWVWVGGGGAQPLPRASVGPICPCGEAASGVGRAAQPPPPQKTGGEAPTHTQALAQGSVGRSLFI